MADSVRDSEARLQAIVNTAIDSIITIDERGIIESCNPATERIFGYRAEELIGRNVSVLMASPDREQHDTYLQRYLETGVARIIGIGREVTGRRKDGSQVPLDLAVSEVWLGERRFFTGILRDISEKKRAEERALHVERLAAIGQMMTGLVHESRNALQRTLACVEMLELEVEGNATARDLLRRIERAQDDLQRLLEEVRGYASPLSLDLHECSLPETWHEAWNLLAPQRSGRAARLIERVEGEEVCRADGFRLVQVFRNLFENSLAACADPVEISIHAKLRDVDRVPMIEIAVRDNGPGIAAEQRDQVFEPFFTTKTKGTGLGLAIARRILEAHQGTLSLGEPNGGMVIILRIPCHRSARVARSARVS